MNKAANILLFIYILIVGYFVGYYDLIEMTLR
jgi:hypothetical protein